MKRLQEANFGLFEGGNFSIQLKLFNIGRGFLENTLHSGAFRSMMALRQKADGCQGHS